MSTQSDLPRHVDNTTLSSVLEAGLDLLLGSSSSALCSQHHGHHNLVSESLQLEIDAGVQQSLENLGSQPHLFHSVDLLEHRAWLSTMDRISLNHRKNRSFLSRPWAEQRRDKGQCGGWARGDYHRTSHASPSMEAWRL